MNARFPWIIFQEIWGKYLNSWGNFQKIWGKYLDFWGNFQKIWGKYLDFWGEIAKKRGELNKKSDKNLPGKNAGKSIYPY